MQTRQIIRGVGFIVVLALVGVGWYLSANSAGAAAVGECLKEAGGEDLAQVECNSPEAAFRVIGRIEDKKSSEADLACADFESATVTYWEGERRRFQSEADAKGAVLCLEPVA